jgi:hypothetical protein
LRPGSGEQFQLKTKFFLEGFLVFLSQDGRRRAAGDDLAFILRRFDYFFPFLLRLYRKHAAD